MLSAAFLGTYDRWSSSTREVTVGAYLGSQHDARRPAAWAAGAGIPSDGLPWGTGAHEIPARGVRPYPPARGPGRLHGSRLAAQHLCFG